MYLPYRKKKLSYNNVLLYSLVKPAGQISEKNERYETKNLLILRLVTCLIEINFFYFLCGPILGTFFDHLQWSIFLYTKISDMHTLVDILTNK